MLTKIMSTNLYSCFKVTDKLTVNGFDKGFVFDKLIRSVRKLFLDEDALFT